MCQKYLDQLFTCTKFPWVLEEAMHKYRERISDCLRHSYFCAFEYEFILGMSLLLFFSFCFNFTT